MSKSLSIAGRNVARLARSTHRPDGFSRGFHREETIVDDTVGEAIYTPAPEPEVEDKYTRLAIALEAVEHHRLVKEFGFAPDSLITNVDTDSPVAMGFETLAVTLAACQAADTLADLAGPLAVCQVLGWTAPTPPALKDFGADRLFRNVGALQARIAQIRAERARPAPVAPAAVKTGGIKPRLAIPAARMASPATAKPPAAKPMPSIDEVRKPVGSDWLGRVTTAQGLAYVCTCGCNVPVLEKEAQVPPFEVMNGRQGSKVLATDLWAHAFAPRCIRAWGRGFSLVETRNSAFKAEQNQARRHAPPAFRAVHVRRPDDNQGASGTSGKGAPATQLAKKAARAEADRQLRLRMQTAGKK